jgi:hypothetical protein
LGFAAAVVVFEATWSGRLGARPSRISIPRTWYCSVQSIALASSMPPVAAAGLDMHNATALDKVTTGVSGDLLGDAR